MKTIVTYSNNTVPISTLSAGDVCKYGVNVYLITKDATLVNVVTGGIIPKIPSNTLVYPALSAELNVTF